MQVAGSTSSSDVSGKSGGGSGAAGNASHSDGEGAGGRIGEGMSSSADAKRPIIDRVSLRDNVALIAVLELKEDAAFKRTPSTPVHLRDIQFNSHSI